MYNIYMNTKSSETQKALKHKSSETQIKYNQMLYNQYLQ